MAALGDLAPPAGSWPFVGRDREVAELVAGLKDTIGGQGGLFLVTGEPGIGKTWLVEHLTRYATERGIRVLWGRCWEGGGAPPFWPWGQVIGAVAEDRDEQTLASWFGTRTAQVAQLVPGLAERFGLTTVTGVLPRESDAARFDLFEAVTDLFRRAVSAQPLLLAFDDLPAANDPSRLLLEFMVRQLRGARLLVVGDPPRRRGSAVIRHRRRAGAAGARRAATRPSGAGSRRREGPHRGALGGGALPGGSGRRLPEDRGQPPVRPRARAPAGHRRHPATDRPGWDADPRAACRRSSGGGWRRCRPTRSRCCRPPRWWAGSSISHWSAPPASCR
jgi:AAA ATPase domain